MNYIKLSEGFTKHKFVVENELYNEIKNFNTEWFSSVYYYPKTVVNEVLEKQKTTGVFSVAGIKTVVSKKLWWDFDSENDLNVAHNDTKMLVSKLLNLGFKEENIQVCYSGNKGFSVVIDINKELNRKEVENICRGLADGLQSFDSSMYDEPQIFRVPLTKNLKTGLYKTPISLHDLNTLTVKEIKEQAEDVSDIKPTTLKEVWKTSEWINTLNDFIKPIKKDKPKTTKQTHEIDFSQKPKFLTNCRFALQEGYFKEGNRSNSLLCLASTYKNLNYREEHVYRLLKGVCELQAKKNNTERFPDEELYNRIIMQVYGPHWKGGQFSCKQEGWLKDYCLSLGEHSCEKTATKNSVVQTDDIFNLFKNYSEKYEENVLATGIPDLDKNMALMVGTSNAILAPPGCGKTSISLQILNHNSLIGNQSIFFSYDMFHANLYMRMIQRHTGFNQDVIYDIFKNDPHKANEIKELLKKEYKNVKFCFKAGQTADELKDTILETENNTGQKVKLVVVDYNDLVMSQFSDPTQASSETAQKLRQIANETETCVLTLLQPSKLYSSPAEDITTFNAAKGSSTIAQSMTLMLGCSRPGFNPKDIKQDKYFNITCLKNRNGPLFSVDLGWNGLKGEIRNLEDFEKEDLEILREAKKLEKESNKKNWD